MSTYDLYRAYLAQVPMFSACSKKDLQTIGRASDEVSVAAGLPAGQLYAHQDGASWDYLVISPVTTPEQDKKLAALKDKIAEKEKEWPKIRDAAKPSTSAKKSNGP